MKQRSRKNIVKSIFRIIGLYFLSVVAGSLFLFTPVARAAPLHLTLNDFPDIASYYIDVTYDAGSDLLTADGSALQLDDDGSMSAETILGGSFLLTATIDDLGNLSGGTLNIEGTVSSLGFISGTLLTGNLTAFGFDDADDPFEFLFNVTGGDAAGLYGSVPAGVILSETGISGNFTADFDNLDSGVAGTGSGVSNTAPVPIPSTLLLFGSGLMGLDAARRKFTKKQ